MLNHSQLIKSEAVRKHLLSFLFIASNSRLEVKILKLHALGGQQWLLQINFFALCWSTFVVKLLAHLLEVLGESILTC